MAAQITLLLGGARSGKSAAAQRMAEGEGRVLFVATAEGLDEEMRQRIDAHRQDRPGNWDTLEAPRHLISALRPRVDRYDTIVVDCLTMWASNLLLELEDYGDAERRLATEATRLVALMEASDAAWILVSNEVGMGLVPPSPVGRAYRDALGRVNQIIAASAGSVRLMVAGLSMEMRPGSPGGG